MRGKLLDLIEIGYSRKKKLCQVTKKRSGGLQGPTYTPCGPPIHNISWWLVPVIPF
jgi:hypothetical protein